MKINDIRSYLSEVSVIGYLLQLVKLEVYSKILNPLDFFYDNFMINNNILRVACEKN